MARPVAECKMCLEKKPLESSHLIPSAVYDYCRPPGGDPLAFTSEFIAPSSRQAQHYLLCSDCEDVLNKNGERWLNPKLATHQKIFPLYELITTSPSVLDDGNQALFHAASNPDISVPSIVHFGMGIFWKAAVHSWKKETIEPWIELGPYAEQIRLFLRSEADFPKNLALIPVLSTPAGANISISFPFETVRPQGFRSFWFDVPGIQFRLFAGKLITQELRAMCVRSNPHGPIIVSESLTRQGKEAMAQVLRTARKTKSFAEYMKKLGIPTT
jgi:hypothetical protein